MTGRKNILLVTGMSRLPLTAWQPPSTRRRRRPPGRRATALPEGADGDERPLALGIGPQTRGFDADHIVRRIKTLREEHGHDIGTLFLDCAGAELERRYSETRRRHPLALDRPASEGIARERELLTPLRDWANRVIDTTSLSSNALAQTIRATFADDGMGDPVLSVMSFGFARGLPPNADLVFDMRYLRNPHWVPDLRPGTGLDAVVADYVAGDPAYPGTVAAIEDLLLMLLPRYHVEGKSYVTVAIGCTGGRHRSVHVAERIAARLQAAGFSPTVTHRDLGTAPQDSLEDAPKTR